MNAHRKLGLSIGKSLLAVTLAAGIVGGANVPDARAALSDSSMACGQGTETVYFGLPYDSSPRWSIFAYSVDGGAWQWTNWYWLDHGSFSYWEASRGQLVSLPLGSSQRTIILGNHKLVDGWEYRYSPSTASGSWVHFPSCRTTSYFDGGIVYR